MWRFCASFAVHGCGRV
uniref:Uncharacterized protein n=1 Tax=Anopheles quadriannulatus TaxID=34691 RepID=A0A182XU17_ANOQN